MPGEAPLISLDEATARLLADVRPLAVREVPLTEALGRYLVTPVTATQDQPPFDGASMDGYAVADTATSGTRLTVIGEAAAGHALDGTIGTGEAARISTGAPLPPGATRVIPQEFVTRDGAAITIDTIGRNRNIRHRGRDYTAGVTLSPGRLGPAGIGLLAAMNVPRAPVARRPIVTIIPTGDELVPPGAAARPDQIIASNGVMLKALAESAGARVELFPVAGDERARLDAALARAIGSDVIVTIGGASVGDHDLVADATRAAGAEPLFRGVALRPGRPTLAARLQGATLLGLPGNPGGALTCGHLFLLPLLRALQGDPAPLPPRHVARLAHALDAEGARTRCLPARLAADRGTIRALDRPGGYLPMLALADAFIIRPANDPARETGAEVTWIPLAAAGTGSTLDANEEHR